MNAARAKQIPMKELLSSLGHQPVKEVRGELWYLSPFRQESEPSFKVNQERNIWYDFGEGEGGNVLDFTMRYYQVNSVAEALSRLSHFEPGRSPTRSHPAQARPLLDTSDPAGSTNAIKVTKVQRLMNRVLIEYLEKRGISVQTARPYLQEIYYTRKGKSYFALAFPNKSGGYEMRNPYYKGTHGAKDLSMLGDWGGTIRAGEISVFEGFMDYLSALIVRALTDTMPVIVLNSVTMKDRAVKTIREQGGAASRVHLYLDHDTPGRELTIYLKAQLPGLEVLDRSELYNDFNEYLQARTRQL